MKISNIQKIEKNYLVKTLSKGCVENLITLTTVTSHTASDILLFPPGPIVALETFLFKYHTSPLCDPSVLIAVR
jgi:hypothetical protein